MIFLNMITMCIALKIVSYFFAVNELLDALKIIDALDLGVDDYSIHFKDNVLSRDNYVQLVEERSIKSFLPLKHYLVFLFMPTLCFQLTYPRTQRIRPLYLLKMGGLYILTQMIML